MSPAPGDELCCAGLECYPDPSFGPYCISSYISNTSSLTSNHLTSARSAARALELGGAQAAE
jgi:hypothetical protein